jgi:hypothetical protein
MDTGSVFCFIGGLPNASSYFHGRYGHNRPDRI